MGQRRPDGRRGGGHGRRGHLGILDREPVVALSVVLGGIGFLAQKIVLRFAIHGV